MSDLTTAAAAIYMNILRELEKQEGWRQFEFFNPTLDLYWFYRLGKALGVDDPAKAAELLNEDSEQ